MHSFNEYSQLWQRAISILENGSRKHASKAMCLDQAYSASYRHYHGCQHILMMLELLEGLKDELTPDDLRAVQLMVLYHDVWFKIARNPGENERRSADWARSDLSEIFLADHYFQEIVPIGIMATIDHKVDSVPQCYKKIVGLFLDLDLWGLGQSLEYFQEDTEKVWQEYEPIATREEFGKGREDWARDFLQRQRIYHSRHFAGLEDQARQNLQALVMS